jgi:hypothetical protein
MCIKYLGITCRSDIHSSSVLCLAKQLNPLMAHAHAHTNAHTHTHTHTHTHIHGTGVTHPQLSEITQKNLEHPKHVVRPHPVQTTFQTRQSLLPGKSDLTSYSYTEASYASQVLTLHLALRLSLTARKLNFP